MKKTLQILRHEIYTLVSRPSFWFGLLGVPAIAFLIYALVFMVNRSQGTTGAPNPVQEILTPPEDPRPQGFVDQAQLLANEVYGSGEGQLIGFANIKAAQEALDEGAIRAFYVIPPDYTATGRLVVYTSEFNLVEADRQAEELVAQLNLSLLGGDEALARQVRQPVVEWEEVNLSPTPETARDRDSWLTFTVPYVAMMLFYMSIMGSAGLLLNSVTKEKENRLVEILMLSSTPHQLLLGKIAGLGLVGLLQVLVWSTSAYLLLRLRGESDPLVAGFQLDPSILAWGAVFFLLGYLVYASLMAGIGALVPGMREGTQATTVVVLPLFIPLFLISALIHAPNGGIATILSLFPFTAPTTMMLRLAATNVPLWQVLLAVVLLAATALLVVRAVARMFRAQALLSGQPLSIKRYFRALLGKM